MPNLPTTDPTADRYNAWRVYTALPGPETWDAFMEATRRWQEAERRDDADDAGRRLARQMRMRLEIAGPTGAERNHT